MPSGSYVECREGDVPEGVRFDTPRINQGQIVEYCYGTFGRSEAGYGDPFRLIIDHSNNSRTYYKWVPKK